MSLEVGFILKRHLLQFQKKLDLYYRCLLKRHFPQFHKIQYIPKVSLEETPSIISQILIYTTSGSWIWFYIERVSSRDTFHNFTNFNYTTSVSWIWFYIEGVSPRDTFYNSKKIGFILRCVFKRHFPQFNKFQYILKGSLQETHSMISQILIYTTSVFWIWFYIEGVSSRDTFYNSKKIEFILKRHLPQFSYIVENFEFMLKVSLSTKEKKNYLLISITLYTTKCLKFITCIHYN